MCLLARCPEPCDCRCGGAFHGMLADAGVECDEDKARAIAAATASRSISADRAIEMIRSILTAPDLGNAAARLRAMAVLEGYEDLPRGAELERLAKLTSVSRRSAFAARKLRSGHGSRPGRVGP